MSEGKHTIGGLCNKMCQKERRPNAVMALPYCGWQAAGRRTGKRHADCCSMGGLLRFSAVVFSAATFSAPCCLLLVW